MKKVAETSERLRECMNNKKLRAYEIEQATGISHSTISLYLSGKRHPSDKAIKKLADFLGVNEVWLMGYDTDPRPINNEPIPELKELEELLLRLPREDIKKVLNFTKEYIVK